MRQDDGSKKAVFPLEMKKDEGGRGETKAMDSGEELKDKREEWREAESEEN